MPWSQTTPMDQKTQFIAPHHITIPKLWGLPGAHRARARKALEVVCMEPLQSACGSPRSGCEVARCEASATHGCGSRAKAARPAHRSEEARARLPRWRSTGWKGRSGSRSGAEVIQDCETPRIHDAVLRRLEHTSSRRLHPLELDFGRASLRRGARERQPCIPGLRVTFAVILNLLASGQSRAGSWQAVSYLHSDGYGLLRARGDWKQ
jgi:hypothetical protein